MKPFRLNRRALLRGAGTIAVALPWLEAMVEQPAAAQTPGMARRFVAVYQPGGTVIDQWTPVGTENAFTLSPILAPLEPIAQKLIVLSGVDMQSAVGEQRQSGIVAWLTGTEQAAGGFAQGPSLDQVVASIIADGRTHKSLELAIRWGTGKSRGAVSPINIANFADDATFSPIAPRIDPQAIWNAVFGELDPEATPSAAAQRRNRSVLDYLDRRYDLVARRLGVADRARLEAHLLQIRELELTLQQLPSGGSCSLPDRVDTTGYDPAAGLGSDDNGNPVNLPTDTAIPLVGRFMMDMLVMALACDLTAVGTLQWSDTESKHTFPWLDLPETHDFYRNGGGYRPADCAKIGTWYSEQHAYLLQKMAAVDMGGHSLLDESILFFGSEIRDPPTHLKDNMPFLLAGGGGLRAGRWLSYGGRSHNDLLVALLNLFGDPRQSFGDPLHCDEPLEGLA